MESKLDIDSLSILVGELLERVVNLENANDQLVTRVYWLDSELQDAKAELNSLLNK